MSDITVMYTCTPPSQLASPRFVSTTSTSMTISWDAPLNDGGCPITGYAVFRDDGSTEVPNIEVNQNNDPSVRDIPVLRQVTAQLSATDIGKKFKYEIRAYNREGFVAAQSVCFLFAIIPPTPTNSPTVIQTTSSSITVSYNTLQD